MYYKDDTNKIQSALELPEGATELTTEEQDAARQDMRYWRSAAGDVFAFDALQIADGWPNDETLAPMTEAEVQEHLHPTPTLEQAKARKLAEVNAAFEAAGAALTARYPQMEQQTWDIQRQEATAWAADNNAPTPFLDAAAQARGIDAEEMRQLTLANVTAFQQAAAQAVGIRQALRDAIDAAQSLTEVGAVAWPA